VVLLGVLVSEPVALVGAIGRQSRPASDQLSGSGRGQPSEPAGEDDPGGFPDIAERHQVDRW
jgi:hypothetical protein